MDIKIQNLALKSILVKAKKNKHKIAVKKQKDADERKSGEILKGLDAL